MRMFVTYVLAAGLMVGAAYSQTGQSHPIPLPLTETGEGAENLYEAAHSDDWSVASQKLQSLRHSVENLRVPVGMGSHRQKIRSALQKLA